MKSLHDIKQDMSTLYDAVESGSTDLKVASELANIAGKYLKAEQLELAREIFLHHQRRQRTGVNGVELLESTSGQMTLSA